MSDTIRVEGLRELGRVFRAAGDGMPAKLLGANRTASEAIAAEARARAVVGKPDYFKRNRRSGGTSHDTHPGRYRDSIRALASQRGAAVKVGGARVPYANPIHWGWPKHGIPRRPVLQDALRDLHSEVDRAYQDAVDNLVREIH